MVLSMTVHISLQSRGKMLPKTLALLTICTCILCICTIVVVSSEELNTRIYNGLPAAKGQFPWQVALHIPKNDRMSFCGGAIISDMWVLTAAHCLVGAHFRIRVLLGTTKSTGDDPDQVELHAREWLTSALFDPWVFENDIALVKLPEALGFNDYIQPIALASEDIGVNTSVSASGWGATDENNTRSEDLTFTNLFTTNDSCSQTPGIICVVPDPSNEAQNICGGDSGGALVVNASTSPVHVGIVSFYHSCQPGLDAGFTSVAYHREWIRDNSGV